MNKNSIAKIALVLAVLAIVFLIWDRNRWKDQAKESAQERDEANEKNNLFLAENQILRQNLHQMYDDIVRLQDALVKGDAIEISMLAKLNDLIVTYKDIDERVSSELSSTIRLIEANEPVKATFGLTKVVENLLKDRFQNDPGFKSFIGRRDATLAEYLNYAETTGLIGKDELGFARGMKEMRNQEGHELHVQKERGFVQSVILFGIGMIAKLCPR